MWEAIAHHPNNVNRDKHTTIGTNTLATCNQSKTFNISTFLESGFHFHQRVKKERKKQVHPCNSMLHLTHDTIRDGPGVCKTLSKNPRVWNDKDHGISHLHTLTHINLGK